MLEGKVVVVFYYDRFFRFRYNFPVVLGLHHLIRKAGTIASVQIGAIIMEQLMLTLLT